MHEDLKDICEKVIEASLYWTGCAEEINPRLKTIRTLAGYYLTKHDEKDLLEKTVQDYLNKDMIGGIL